MRYVKAQEGTIILLGRQGENEVVTVQFDVSGWAEMYGEGTFKLAHQRCRDGDGYERTTTLNGNTLEWLITNVDVAYAGRGTLQLTYTVGDAVAKSVLYTTKVERSLDETESVPDPWKNWVDQIEEASEDAVEAADNAEASEENASASEQNAEAWAVGQRGGVDVPETDTTYHNNSKYYAEQSALSATASAQSAESAEQSATLAQMYVGAPLTASTASGMTDHNRIYVYVGSEAGYSSGHWYYWNGTAWTDGGVYNSIADDIATNADIDALLYS